MANKKVIPQPPFKVLTGGEDEPEVITKLTVAIEMANKIDGAFVVDRCHKTVYRNS